MTREITDAEKGLWAGHWDTTLRTIYRWLAAHQEGRMPHFMDVRAMLEWGLTAKGLTPAVRNRMGAIRSGTYTIVGADLVGEPKEIPRNGRWEKHKAERAKKPRTDLSDLEDFRDYYASMLDEAIEKGNASNIKLYNELLLDTANSIRQQKLAADKLGIEEGQLFTKEQLAKFIRSFAFWSMKGIDADLADLCKQIPGIKGVNEARLLLEPTLLSSRFVKPFAKASRVESESALSGWMVETVKDAVDDYVESKDEKFAEFL